MIAYGLRTLTTPPQSTTPAEEQLHWSYKPHALCLIATARNKTKISRGRLQASAICWRHIVVEIYSKISLSTTVHFRQVAAPPRHSRQASR